MAKRVSPKEKARLKARKVAARKMMKVERVKRAELYQHAMLKKLKSDADKAARPIKKAATSVWDKGPEWTAQHEKEMAADYRRDQRHFIKKLRKVQAEAKAAKDPAVKAAKRKEAAGLLAYVKGLGKKKLEHKSESRKASKKAQKK